MAALQFYFVPLFHDRNLFNFKLGNFLNDCFTQGGLHMVDIIDLISVIETNDRPCNISSYRQPDTGTNPCSGLHTLNRPTLFPQHPFLLAGRPTRPNYFFTSQIESTKWSCVSNRCFTIRYPLFPANPSISDCVYL